jgi:hypothetical protein
MSVDEKWRMLSNDDQLFVEQIINQLLELGGGAISDREYAANLERLEKMKEEPELYAKDAFQVLKNLKEKIRDDKS